MKNPAEFANVLKLMKEKGDQIELAEDFALLQSLWQQRLAAGEAALTDDDFPVAIAGQLLTALISHYEKKTLINVEAEELVHQYLAQNSIRANWQNIGITPERGDMYIHLSCKFALEKLASKVRDVITLDTWDNNTCPVCGDVPAFGCYEKPEGRRSLVCGSCQTHWRYKRIGCGFCSEENSDQLKVVTADEFPGWSAIQCQTCNGYLKIADLRMLATAPNWHEALIKTLPLDYALTRYSKSS